MYHVILKTDSEGMYDGATDEDMADIDHDATLAEYNRQVIAELRKYWSSEEMSIEMRYGPYVGPSIKVLVDGDDPDWDEVTDWVGEYINRVWNRGEFWITV